MSNFAFASLLRHRFCISIRYDVTLRSTFSGFAGECRFVKVRFRGLALLLFCLFLLFGTLQNNILLCRVWLQRFRICINRICIAYFSYLIQHNMFLCRVWFQCFKICIHTLCSAYFSYLRPYKIIYFYVGSDFNAVGYAFTRFVLIISLIWDPTK